VDIFDLSLPSWVSIMAALIEELILALLVDGQIFEDLLDVHYQVKTGLLSLENVYNVSGAGVNTNSIAGAFAVEDGSGSSSSSGNSAQGRINGGQTVPGGGAGGGLLSKAAFATKPSGKATNAGGGKSGKNNFPMIAQCPVCLEQVSGMRFAPHLEKCINGGKRVSVSRTSLYDDAGWLQTKKVPFTDPYPSSHIIRIKTMRNGVPRANLVREGVSLEEWLQVLQQQQS
jgi:hypothetical protein